MLGKEFKILALGITTLTIGIVLIATNFLVTPSTTSATSGVEGETITYHSAVCKKVTRTDGRVDDFGCSKNLFTRAGMNYTRDQLSGPSASVTDMNYPGTGVIRVIGIANASGTQCLPGQGTTNTTLCGELTLCGLGRGAADAVRVNGSSPFGTAGNWSITREFTYSCGGTADINATGLFNSTTANDTREVFFAQNTFTTATLNQNDKINITWFIWVV